MGGIKNICGMNEIITHTPEPYDNEVKNPSHIKCSSKAEAPLELTDFHQWQCGHLSEINAFKVILHNSAAHVSF